MKVFTLFIFVFLLSSSFVEAQSIALVYKGPGSCEEGCSESAAKMAEMAGLKAIFVTPEETSPSLFREAKVWIQPGGRSSLASKTMAPELKENIRRFVNSGGGYVGFCAGGFFATEWISDRGVEGLGILPGSNDLYIENEKGLILPLLWEGRSRQLYFEGGPYFIPPTNLAISGQMYEPTAFYEDGKIASVRSIYGRGRVYVTGLHPEAPQEWREYYKIQDTDGLDFDLAVDMIHWAIRN